MTRRGALVTTGPGEDRSQLAVERLLEGDQVAVAGVVLYLERDEH